MKLQPNDLVVKKVKSTKKSKVNSKKKVDNSVLELSYEEENIVDDCWNEDIKGIVLKTFKF